MISLIAAMSESALIGKDNQLPWNVPEELKYFRSMTRNKAIIMGSKTFESIGRPLPNRYNIVLSRGSINRVCHQKSFPECGPGAYIPVFDDFPSMESTSLGGTRENFFDASGVPKDVHMVASATEAIDCAERYIKDQNANPEIMVIGGAKIYELFMPYATCLYLSIIPGDYQGDTFFPAIDWKQWDLKSEEPMDGFKAKIFSRNST